MTRARLSPHHPVHVTVRLRDGLPTLRSRRVYGALREAFMAGCERFGFRLVHYSVQSNHMHLLVEAKGREALSRGMQGLLIRVAKKLNKLWQRRGSVFADRYHDHILRTPREVRHALVYVLQNAMRHGRRFRNVLDYYASGWWFEGWREKPTIHNKENIAPPIAKARTWLLRLGWRRHRLISVYERPLPT